VNHTPLSPDALMSKAEVACASALAPASSLLMPSNW